MATLEEYEQKTKKRYVTETTTMPVTITQVTDTDTDIVLELATVTGELLYKDISKHKYSKSKNFLTYALGADLRNWQGKKLWFSRVDKYLLPVRAE